MLVHIIAGAGCKYFLTRGAALIKSRCKWNLHRSCKWNLHGSCKWNVHGSCKCCSGSSSISMKFIHLFLCVYTYIYIYMHAWRVLGFTNFISDKTFFRSSIRKNILIWARIIINADFSFSKIVTPFIPWILSFGITYLYLVRRFWHIRWCEYTPAHFDTVIIFIR